MGVFSKFLNSNSIMNSGPDWKQAIGFICYPRKTRRLFLFCDDDDDDDFRGLLRSNWLLGNFHFRVRQLD
jgi:hypothetical protein